MGRMNWRSHPLRRAAFGQQTSRHMSPASTRRVVPSWYNTKMKFGGEQSSRAQRRKSGAVDMNKLRNRVTLLTFGSEELSEHSRSQTDSCYCEPARRKKFGSMDESKCSQIVSVSQPIQEKETESSRIECPKWKSSRPDGNHGSTIRSEAREVPKKPSA